MHCYQPRVISLSYIILKLLFYYVHIVQFHLKARQRRKFNHFLFPMKILTVIHFIPSSENNFNMRSSLTDNNWKKKKIFPNNPNTKDENINWMYSQSVYRTVQFKDKQCTVYNVQGKKTGNATWKKWWAPWSWQMGCRQFLHYIQF